jgi:hypothetical protein
MIDQLGHESPQPISELFRAWKPGDDLPLPVKRPLGTTVPSSKSSFDEGLKAQWRRDYPIPSEVPNADIERVSKDIVDELRAAIKQRVRSILISGRAGIGKTYALAAVFRAMWNWHPPEVAWYRLETIIELMAQCQKSSTGNFVVTGKNGASALHYTRANLVKKWATPRTLFVDDLGTSSLNEFTFPMAFDLFQSRLENTTIYSTNKSIEELTRMYDDRIASRLVDGICITMDGDDRRLARARFLKLKAS